jgi:hypothetical protein
MNKKMDLSGFEPEASSMPRRRSSELIYKPIIQGGALNCFKQIKFILIIVFHNKMNYQFQVSPELFSL